MDIPSDIENRIIEYLNLEYGHYKDAQKIQTSDLRYEGVKIIDGKEVKFWKYPCSQASGCWATVEKYEDGFLINLSNSLPASE